MVLPAMSSLKLFGSRTVRMECWFCQRVNVLQSNSSDRKGKAKAAIFPLEGTKDNFKCKFCGNRNLRDREGNLSSNLPEMYNPAFNSPSWMDNTPQSSSSARSLTDLVENNPLCSRCRTNQVLLLNYKANYFPEDADDPRLQRLEQTFDADVAEFEQSFPPLCENCTPKVDEIIKKKDYDAQINAWKVFLSSGSPDAIGAGIRHKGRGKSALDRSTAIVWGLAVLTYLPYRIFTKSSFFSYSNFLFLAGLLYSFRDDPLLHLVLDWGNRRPLASRYGAYLRQLQAAQLFSISMLHGRLQVIISGVCIAFSFLCAVHLILLARASAQAERLRLTRLSNDLDGEKSANESLPVAKREGATNDPFNLASMIRNMTRTHHDRIRPAADDIFEPRGTPAIQLSPSPELEPLPTLENEFFKNDGRDPDSMDWEPTDLVAVKITPHTDSQREQSSATSIWERFATTKQRMFARQRLTGLERAFESWRDLGSSAVAQSEPQSQSPSSMVSAARSRSLVPATLMLASVLRVLSAAVNVPRTSNAKDAAIVKDLAWFRITASILEIICTIPRVIYVRRFHFRYVLPVLSIFLAFMSIIAGLQQTQIVLVGLGQSVLAHRVYIMDAIMVVMDLAAGCTS
ncbi:hypothetical protein NliqN6_2107 [Naganishia liquefaciens]|uniref:Ima1 N-terminal domain-containing protein n=1 Tax=Naganishia liquefaciens TaxID=104408 RepID=A0A8H3YDQ5_9TREE|nr:hypothetical protein NliqN6_2107 [Naganishia liquefaciens]